MTVDKFGRNLSHPYHLTKKLKKPKDVVIDEDQEDRTKQLFGFMNITLTGEADPSRKYMINGQSNYRFPIESGTIEYVNMEPFVRTKINKKEYPTPKSLLHQELKFNDKISFTSSDASIHNSKLSAEFVIKYPVVDK